MLKDKVNFGVLIFQFTGQSQIKVEFTLALGGLFPVFVVDCGKINIGRDGGRQKAANKVLHVLRIAHEVLEKIVVGVRGFRAHGLDNVLSLLLDMIMGDVYPESTLTSSIKWVFFYSVVFRLPADGKKADGVV